MKTIKQKLKNHMLLNGQKNTCDHLLIKTFKILQKCCTTNSAQLLLLNCLDLLPIFKMNIFSQKQKQHQKQKKIPSFIKTEKARISKSLKLVLLVTKNKNLKHTHVILAHKILLNAQSKNLTTEYKNDLQKAVIGTKNLFKYYYKN